MNQRVGLMPTLERLFAGPRESQLSLQEFLTGLGDRSYAFVIAALDLPNCIPTGIPFLSTVTGVPMLMLLVEEFGGSRAALLPDFIGLRAFPRGRLQDFLIRARITIVWLERRIHPRNEWWLLGLPRQFLLLAWTVDIVILALPIPLDNLLPAWAILFFCLALLESDGVMAMLGWLFTLVTVAWTAFLALIGPYVVYQLIRNMI